MSENGFFPQVGHFIIFMKKFITLKRLEIFFYKIWYTGLKQCFFISKIIRKFFFQ